MPAIGETLREARLRRDVDIAEVSARTKIRTKYLRALEADDFDQLPGPTYVRTFLRTYAGYLGLDAQLLVEEYRSRYEQPEEEQLTPFAPAPVAARESRPLRPRAPRGSSLSPGRLAAVATVALVALFLVVGILTEPDGRPEPQRTTPAAPTRGSTEPDEPTEKRDPPKPDRVELVVRPDGPTYLCVDDGAGNVVFESEIDAPERFRGRRLRINLGRAAGEVEANGRPVEIEEGPNPIGYEFEPGRSRALPDGERPCQ
jgi:cytoskeleton protein RodZ